MGHWIGNLIRAVYYGAVASNLAALSSEAGSPLLVEGWLHLPLQVCALIASQNAQDGKACTHQPQWLETGFGKVPDHHAGLWYPNSLLALTIFKVEAHFSSHFGWKPGFE